MRKGEDTPVRAERRAPAEKKRRWAERVSRRMVAVRAVMVMCV